MGLGGGLEPFLDLLGLNLLVPEVEALFTDKWASPPLFFPFENKASAAWSFHQLREVVTQLVHGVVELEGVERIRKSLKDHVHLSLFINQCPHNLHIIQKGNHLQHMDSNRSPGPHPAVHQLPDRCLFGLASLITEHVGQVVHHTLGGFKVTMLLLQHIVHRC